MITVKGKDFAWLFRARASTKDAGRYDLCLMAASENALFCTDGHRVHRLDMPRKTNRLKEGIGPMLEPGLYFPAWVNQSGAGLFRVGDDTNQWPDRSVIDDWFKPAATKRLTKVELNSPRMRVDGVPAMIALKSPGEFAVVVQIRYLVDVLGRLGKPIESGWSVFLEDHDTMVLFENGNRKAAVMPINSSIEKNLRVKAIVGGRNKE